MRITFATVVATVMSGCVLAAQQAPKSPLPPQDGPFVKTASLGEPPAATTTVAAPAVDERALLGTDGDARAQELPAAPQLADAVLFDEPQPGQIWAMAPTWKAGFTADGATFVPFFGSSAPCNQPAHFAVTGAQVGGIAIDCTAAAAQRQDDVVAIARGGMVEQYVTSMAGIEQRFVFAQLPQRGELSVTVAVTSDYVVQQQGEEHVFACDLGSFRYGAAVAFDAVGKRVAMTTHWTGSAMELTVPAWFVRSATLPLVIDPLVGNVNTLTSSAYHHPTTDIAYDASLDLYVICYERQWSLTDSDIIVVRCDGQMQQVGNPLLLDNTTTSWRNCRIAGLDVYDEFLVVAECGLLSAGPTWIAGRTFHAGNVTMSVQFDIEHGTKACSHPDVGGDPSHIVPVYWTVVFERHYSSSDHDIMMRQVTNTSALRGTGMTIIDSSVDYHHAPVISKSNGTGAFTTQAWLIAYRRENAPAQQTSVYGTYSSWDGQVSASQAISGWFSNVGNPPLEVSSPTMTSLGRNFAMVVGQVDASSLNMVLFASVIDGQGMTVVPRTAITEPSIGRVQPVIETDGSRFVVGYSLAGSGTVYVRTYDVVGNQFPQCDIALCGTNNNPTASQSLCSRYTGGATDADRQYATAWSFYQTGGDSLRVTRYSGMAGSGGAAMRATGCGFGSVTLSSTGDAGALGTANTVQVLSPVGLTGWVIGLPMNQPIAGCPNCVQGSTAMVTVLGPTAGLTVPYNGAFVGVTFAFQAFSFGPGTCLGTLAFSNTIDLTIR